MSIHQEDLSGNPNMQLGGLLAPWPADDGVQTVDEVLSHRVEENRILLECWTSGGEWATVVLTPVDEHVLRYTFYPPGVPREPRQTPLLVSNPPRPLHALTDALPAETEPIVPWIEEDEHLIRIWIGELKCEITKKPFEMVLKNRHDFPILREHRADTNLRGWRRASWLGFRRGADGKIAETFDALALAAEEEIYGMGEKFMPPARRGQKVESWNFNTWGATNERAYKNIPFFVSTRGYGVLLNTTFEARWDFGSGTTSSVSTQIATKDDRLDLFLIYGPMFKDILARYTGLTGRAPVPPRWSFGFWQSKWGYRSWEEVWEVVNTARELSVPMDVVHLDPYWMRDRMYADLVWDEERFPDPAVNLARLREAGIRISLWLHPWIPQQSEVFAEAEAHDAFVKREDGSVYLYSPTIPSNPANVCGIIDFSSERGREWYIGKLLGLIEQGVSAFKTDFGEAIPEDGVFANGMRGWEMHNQYPLLYHEAFYEAFERSGRADDLVCWGRAGWAGIQRYPVPWSGDMNPNFPSMACTLWSGLAMAMSGVPFWSHDIGGFMGPTTPELYIRWAQWGLLSSHSRAHGTTRREPWAIGEQALAVFREFDELRYRLIPYLYSLAVEAHQTGLPVMRPMILEHQDDPALRHADGQYLLGPSILVCPVLEQGAMSKNVYLPKGTWYNFWTETAYEGGRWLPLPVQLEWLPIFVRAGTILPLGPVEQYVGQHAAEHGGPDEVTLRVYPLTLPSPPRGTGHLHEDGGTTQFVYDEGTMTIEPDEGAPRTRTYHVEVVGRDPLKASQRTVGSAQITVQ
ncbi:MAG: glycoside hydrolase family 31 protein [Chloroflexi bacterium]|nr:glycoside hydrolase family 31 protein [Chloroflexota bacterium]